VPEGTRSQALEVLRVMVAADRIGIAEFEQAVARLLEARSEADVAEIAPCPLQSL
jgi:hypothetical protein